MNIPSNILVNERNYNLTKPYIIYKGDAKGLVRYKSFQSDFAC
jgi:hypothetical protein